MKSIRTLSTVSALLVCCTQAVLAEDPVNRMEEVIVTSSRIEMPLRQVGTSVSVISAEEIQQRGFNSLFDVLRSQPAIGVSNAGGAGKITSLRIRGEEGYRTRVLIDGIDLADASAPQIGPRVEQLMSSGIERVEILRGPQGLMYGADAGGVVSISSASPQQGTSADFSAEGGRYGSQQVAGNVGAGNEQVEVSLAATDYQTDGFNARTTDKVLRDDDGYQNTTFHGRLAWHINEDLTLELVGRDVDSNNDYDDCYSVEDFSPTDRCENDYQQQAYRTALNYSAGRFEHQLAYNYSDTDSKFYSDKQFSFGAKGDIERTGYLGSFTATESLRLVYGAELLTESIDDGTFDRDRDQDSVFLEYQGGFGDQLFFTAGVRYDDNDDFGDHTTYRASAAYLVSTGAGDVKLKGAYGTGFRAPSLYEISYNGGPFAYPPASDVTLGAEESEGFDVGIVYYTDTGLYLEANYFDQSIDDEIYFDLATFSGYLQGNGNSDSSGIELIAAIPLPMSVQLSGNYTYNDTESSSGDTRALRPEHLANLGINWRGYHDKLVLGLNVRASRDAIDADGSDLDDYEVVDFNASYQLTRGLQVYGRIENMFDESYQEVPTYRTSGAAGYAGLRYTFN
jgi:vitamin B12 transporter